MSEHRRTHARPTSAGWTCAGRCSAPNTSSARSAQVSEFSRPIQELVTEYCWGAVWTRHGLDRKTRSLLNLVMLTALNRSHELGVARARRAQQRRARCDEIQEVLLQTAVYVGAPAALESFRVAEQVLARVRAREAAE